VALFEDLARRDAIPPSALVETPKKWGIERPSSRHYPLKMGVRYPCSFMRFRLGRRGDLEACQDLLLRDGALAMPDAVQSQVSRVWSDLFARNALPSFAVFEDELSETPSAVCAFAMATFVRDDFARDVVERPRSFLTASVYERELAGERVALEADEVRIANSGEGLHLLILHVVFRHPDLAHPETKALLPVAGYSFFFQHAGYNLRSIFGEVYGDETLRRMQAAGYSVLSAGESATSTRRPYLIRLSRDQTQPSLDPTSLQLFHREMPKFSFTPAEQRVLQHALVGASDRQIAEELDLSTETVRSAWESIYTRVSRVSTRLLGAESSTTRGTEKRRLLLDYVRQHLEELRPTLRTR
jgi:DNA-binding CsgD family transcriptional regulator